MATIAIPILYSDRSMIVDESDAALVRNYRIYFDGGKRHGYAIGTVPGRTGCQKMHRVILGLKVGDRKLVDHINGNRLDNRRENLRIASPRMNRTNAYKVNQNNETSGIQGVCLKNRQNCAKPWFAHIYVAGKKRHLGYFANKAEAQTARKAAEMKYWGFCSPCHGAS